MDTAPPAPMLPPFIDDRPLVSEAGRVFFAESYRKEMLWVRKDKGGTHLELMNEWSSPGRFKVTAENAGLLTATHEDDSATLQVRLNADGSFSGELKHAWGEITTYAPTRYLPVADELAKPVGFVGFLENGTRYRMLVSAHGNEVSGSARFPDTRVDLSVHGTLDRKRRRMQLEETDPSGKVLASYDLVVLWLPPSDPDLPVFPLVDGSVRLETDMHNAYPRRVLLKSGAGLAAQESYDDDCGIDADMVFPVAEGVDASVAKKLEASLRTWMQREYDRFAKIRQDDPLQVIDRPVSFTPGTRQTADDCKKKDEHARVYHTDTYSALALHDDWMAIDITHYTNLSHVMDAGGVSDDCVVVDMTTGSVAEPGAYFTAETRARVRSSAEARLDREKRGDDAMKRPLCIGATDVRLKAPISVFGRQEDVVWTRKEFAALLPDGALRKHVEP